MSATTNEIRSEAAIYAEGTKYTASDLVAAWNRHVAECEAKGEETENVQTFFERLIAG